MIQISHDRKFGLAVASLLVRQKRLTMSSVIRREKEKERRKNRADTKKLSW